MTTPQENPNPQTDLDKVPPALDALPIVPPPSANLVPEAPPPPDITLEDAVTELPIPLEVVEPKLEALPGYDDETMSQRPPSAFDTHQLSEAEVKAYIEARRKRNLKKSTATEAIRRGVLRLELVDTRQSMIIPIKEKILLGRPDPVTGKEPDIDFTTLAGYRMGVSRYHAEIYWLKDNVLQVCDLGSSNGTFVNNERLQPNIPRNFYNGDEIRLGQLALYVYYEIHEDATIIPFRGSRD